MSISLVWLMVGVKEGWESSLMSSPRTESLRSRERPVASCAPANGTEEPTHRSLVPWLAYALPKPRVTVPQSLCVLVYFKGPVVFNREWR